MNRLLPLFCLNYPYSREMRIIKRHFVLVLLYCFLFVWIIGLFQGSPAFQEEVNLAVQQAQLFTQNQINRLLGKKPVTIKRTTNQADDQTDVTNARWTQPSATIYIDLANPTLHSATETAINHWNQTGAFTFHQTKSKADADVVVTAISEHKNGAAGLTTTKMNATTGYIIHADVQLNAEYLLSPAYGYTQDRIINTAEHELGHAIGLQHSSAVSVMQPAGSYYSIQPQDVENVKRLYAKRPTVDGQQQGAGTIKNYQ